MIVTTPRAGDEATSAVEVGESKTDIPLPNVARMQTRPARLDRNEVDLRQLEAGFLRMAPDVAIVGEVGDREALLPVSVSTRQSWSSPI